MRRIVLCLFLVLGLSAPAFAGASCGKTGAGFDAWKTAYAAEARAQGVAVQMHAAGSGGQGSFKSQFKKADASGAQFSLVFGPDELAQGRVAVKPLRGGGEQVLESLAEASVWAARLQSHRA